MYQNQSLYQNLGNNYNSNSNTQNLYQDLNQYSKPANTQNLYDTSSPQQNQPPQINNSYTIDIGTSVFPGQNAQQPPPQGGFNNFNGGAPLSSPLPQFQGASSMGSPLLGSPPLMGSPPSMGSPPPLGNNYGYQAQSVNSAFTNPSVIMPQPQAGLGFSQQPNLPPNMNTPRLGFGAGGPPGGPGGLGGPGGPGGPGSFSMMPPQTNPMMSPQASFGGPAQPPPCYHGPPGW
ncbi:hypothetical protein BCR32DRAFT_328237 [Anaeromyces robustus]|uniref:Uncharacterized protein n=1 Tax=Anaeromyces robustus TaxID=1754192 RepID=A0A1Y1X030_9FUNG|nr:hypothetical protein BCR32DRAFT_328237 [Anaeromyces robustus]|eukprot:ORX79189.1 hypothetical protein BCR32DRAFT_328237 [Anaeromyces robustus]